MNHDIADLALVIAGTIVGVSISLPISCGLANLLDFVLGNGPDAGTGMVFSMFIWPFIVLPICVIGSVAGLFSAARSYSK